MSGVDYSVSTERRGNDNRSIGEYQGGQGYPPLGAPVSPYEAIEDLMQPRGPSLKDFFTLLKKRRRIVFTTLLSVFSLGVLYAFLADDQFTATSVIEIRGYSPVIGEAELETLLQNDTRKLMYQKTTEAKLTHLSLADDVLNKNNLGIEIKDYFRKRKSGLSKLMASFWKLIGLESVDNTFDDEDPRYLHRQTFLSNYLRLIQINPIHETSLVQVRATTTDKRLSQRIANEHAEGLIRFLAEEQRAELSTHLETLKARAQELQKTLAQAEADVTNYAKEHQLVALGDGAQGNLMISHLTELNKLLTAAQSHRVESESKVGGIGTKKQIDNPVLDDETVKDLRTKLKEAEGEYAALSQLVTDEYPKLVELQGKIRSLKNNIQNERQGSVIALKSQYESNLAAEKLILEQFQAQLAKAQAMSGELVQYNLLQREATGLRDLTQSVLRSMNQTQISSASNKANVSISDYAPLPRRPSAPRRNIIVVFSAVLGFICGVGLAVLRELLDSTIKISDDAQAALGLPTLGIIPSFKALGAANLIDREKGLKAKVVGLLPPVLRDRIEKPKPALPEPLSASISETEEELDCAAENLDTSRTDEVIVAALPTSPSETPAPLALPEAAILDALRTLRANILFSSTQNASRVMMIASAREREGKTSVVSNLAVTFARASQRVLLIDGDLRRPKISRRFGIPNERFGLVDYLAGQASIDEILVETLVEHLTVIPAGSATPNPTELLGSAKMGDLIRQLRERFDVILIDGAPVLPVADSLMLAQFAETVIFVVRSGRTEKAVAQEAVKRLRRVGARVRGLVLNDFDPGVGSYSSDRYSVSRYKVITEGRLSTASPEAPITNHNMDESERRAVG